MQSLALLDYSRLKKKKACQRQPDVSVMLFVKRPYRHKNPLRPSLKWNPVPTDINASGFRVRRGRYSDLSLFFFFLFLHSTALPEQDLHCAMCQVRHLCFFCMPVPFMFPVVGLNVMRLIGVGSLSTRAAVTVAVPGVQRWRRRMRGEQQCVGEDRWRTGSVSALTPLPLHFSDYSCGRSRFL